MKAGKKINIALIIAWLLPVFFFNSLHAQPTAFRWSLVLDGYNDVYLADIVVDSNGNTYAGINYTSDLEIPGLKQKLPRPGHVHGLILKIDAEGKTLWAHPFKSSFDNRIKDLALAPNGDLLITGFGDGLLYFPGLKDTLKVGFPRNDNRSYPRLQQGLYAARYSPNGERKWVHYFDCAWGEGMSIAANKKDEVYLSYYFKGTLKQNNTIIDSIPYSSKIEYRYSLAKLDRKGKLVNIQTLMNERGSSYLFYNNIRFDHDDNMILFGNFNGNIHLTPTDSLANDSYYESADSYIAKFNQSGKLIWAKKAGGRNDQRIKGISIAPDNSIYATGTYDFECVLGDNVNVLQRSKYEWKSGTSFFYFHLFSDGELDFARYEDNKGYSSYFMGDDIALDESGKSHIVGYFTDTPHVDGMSIVGPHHNYTGFYSVWSGNKLTKLTNVGDAPKGFIFAWKFAINKNFYTCAGEYHGDSASLNTDNGKKSLPNKDYGRVTYLYGGTIASEPDSSWITSVKDSRNDRIEIVKTLTACTNGDKPVADLWLPIIDSTTKTGSQCGSEIKGMEVSLFPNPTSGEVNIKMVGIHGTTQVEVFSSTGQLVLSHRIQEVTDNQIVSLDLRGLSNGTYIVRITHNNFQKGLRVIKIG